MNYEAFDHFERHPSWVVKISEGLVFKICIVEHHYSRKWRQGTAVASSVSYPSTVSIKTKRFRRDF